MSSPTRFAAAHAARIQDQFSRQAEQFAVAPALHNDEVLSLLVAAANPVPTDTALDVACGPGTVSIALAKRVQRAVGLDATVAMLSQARRLAAEACVQNADWCQGDVYNLPFADGHAKWYLSTSAQKLAMFPQDPDNSYDRHPGVPYCKP